MLHHISSMILNFQVKLSVHLSEIPPHHVSMRVDFQHLLAPQKENVDTQIR